MYRLLPRLTAIREAIEAGSYTLAVLILNDLEIDAEVAECQARERSA